MSHAIIKSKKMIRNNNNVFNKIYYSMPVEFWLGVAIVGASADLIFNYGSTAIVVTLALVMVLGIYLVQTSDAIASIWTKFAKAVKAPQNVIPVLCISTILGTTLMVMTITDSANALIITSSGVGALKGLISGQTFTGAAVTVGTAAVNGSNSAGTNTLAGFAEGIIVLIKVIFALAFLFGLKNSYDKYTERAELTEIVQAPAVLIFVVVAIDGVMNLIFGAT
jgi:hypothetical protein